MSVKIMMATTYPATLDERTTSTTRSTWTSSVTCVSTTTVLDTVICSASDAVTPVMLAAAATAAAAASPIDNWVTINVAASAALSASEPVTSKRTTEAPG